MTPRTRPVADERTRVLAFPKSGIAYNNALYAEMEARGIVVEEGIFAGRWLLQNIWRFQIIHIHWPSFFYGSDEGTSRRIKSFIKFIAFLMFVRLCGKKLYWTAHNLYPHDPCATPGLDWMARRAVNFFASRIFVHGPTAARIFCEAFPSARRKIDIIDHGNWVDYYPRDIDRGTARARLGIAPDAYVYLMIGVCKPYKNLRHLIDSFAGVSGETLLLIAGYFVDPAYEREIMDHVGSLTGAAIRLEPRYIPDESIQEFLVAADAVVLPYTESLTSGAAVLALSFGRPVVAPRMGNLCDIIGDDCGILYDPASESGLREAMVRIRQHAYCEEKILNFARTRTWDSAIEAICGDHRSAG